MNELLERRIELGEKLARQRGLDFYPVVWEEVPREMIWEVASYGLPTRMSHWSFGRSWMHQKNTGEMGFGKIYELILNNNPSYAFLDDTNPDHINTLIVVHCLAHSDFFKKNMTFARSNRNMVNQAERNAHTIDSYKTRYGVEAVEAMMDIGFALDAHIDAHMGESRHRYPEVEVVLTEKHALPFADLFGETDKPQVIETRKNEKVPPHPEKDLLWFLTTYSTKLLPWEREVLSIIRSESFYFWPQMMTKIMNEGWASLWHADLGFMLYEAGEIDEPEYIDYCKAHASVVNPGAPEDVVNGSVNPYFVGFRIYKDIRERWDKYYEEGKKLGFAFEGDEKFDEDGEIVASKLDGNAKIFRVREEDDDISFITNYLTEELTEDMNLMTYGQRGAVTNIDHDDVIIRSRDLQKVIQAFTERLHNYGAPPIFLSEVQGNTIVLTHDIKADRVPLDERYAQETLKYIHRVWGSPVILKTFDRFSKPIRYEQRDSGVSKVSSGEGGKEVDLKL